MAIRDIIWLLSQPLFWAILGIVFGPYLFYRGFRVLQLKRTIMNVPRSTVRGAALGPVEISGKALGPYTLIRAAQPRGLPLLSGDGGIEPERRPQIKDS